METACAVRVLDEKAVDHAESDTSSRSIVASGDNANASTYLVAANTLEPT